MNLRRSKKTHVSGKVRLLVCDEDPLIASKIYTAMMQARLEVVQNLPTVTRKKPEKDCGCSGG